MRFDKFMVLERNQQGFTMIEMLAVLSLVTVILVSITAAYFQVLNVNNRNKERVIVVQQLENMAYWVSCDTLMAQEIATDDNTGTPETEVLTLRRVAWEREDQNNHQHIDSFVVCYTYDDLEIRRHETIVTNEYDSHGSFIQASESQSSILVATHITNVSLAPMFDDNLMVTLTSSFGNTSETRTYQIVPRVGS